MWPVESARMLNGVVLALTAKRSADEINQLLQIKK